MRSRRQKLKVILVGIVLSSTLLSGGFQQSTSLALDPPDMAVQDEEVAALPDMAPELPAEPADIPADDTTIPMGMHTARTAPWVSSPFSGPAPRPAIANFGIIDQGILYRSAQPAGTDYRWLLDHGVKSIVSFRREKPDDRNYLLGLGFKNYLWLDIEDETNPTDQQAQQFLDFVTDPQNWPILIHCKVGLGRTGTMAALVRYAIDGWPMEEAIDEARTYRGGVALVESQEDWLDHWAATHPSACHRPTPPQ